MPRYFGLANTVYIPIWNSAGTDLVTGIATASMSATIYQDDNAGIAASAAPFSAGGGWYGVRLDDAENSADYVRVYLLVSATAANGFAEWENSHDIVEYGTAQAGSATGLTMRSGFKTSGTSAVFTGNLLELLEGTGAGQTRTISTNTSAGGVVISSAWQTNPVAGTIYQIRRQDQDVVDIEALVSAALSTYGVPTSAAVETIVSAVVSGVLQTYGVPTSAAVSTLVSSIVWNHAFTEPAAPPVWTSVNAAQADGWLLMRSLNRHDQTGTKIEIFNSAGTAIASASAGDDGTTARRDQFL